MKIIYFLFILNLQAVCIGMEITGPQESESDLVAVSSGSTPHTNPLMCDICGKVFTKVSNLRRHLTNHRLQGLPKDSPELAGLRCPYCPLVSTTVSSKKIHIQRKHTKEQKNKIPSFILTCSCGKKFESGDLLLGHKARSVDKKCRGGYSPSDETTDPAIDSRTTMLLLQQAETFTLENLEEKKQELQKAINIQQIKVDLISTVNKDNSFEN